MKLKIKYTIVLMLFLHLGIHAQLSPGDLAEPHAKLEGLSNCTECHEIGKKVSSKKCLKCHDEIRMLVADKKGYHASSEVTGKECIQCHSDHNGRKFDMMKFDQDTFNHLLAGYELEGKHAKIDCRKCHVPDNIKEDKIKKRKKTFLGLGTTCLDCHDDYHEETVSSTDCKSCHDMEAFKPATLFNHDDTAYKLNGKHRDVKCDKCHEASQKNGKSRLIFKGVRFNECTACHDDPHQRQKLQECAQCHTESSFSILKAQGRFDHTRTDFKLKGKHRKIDCYSCHTKTENPKLVFKNIQNADENKCAACHSDQHEGKYGTNCAKCHSEQSFLALKNMDFFDHQITDYPLTGMHREVNCKECHPKSYAKEIDFSRCKNCHDDYHKDEFTDANAQSDCSSCHVVDKKFDFTLFTTDDHRETEFELTGAHVATPCNACHQSDRRWKFKSLGNRCVNCHKDVHENRISPKYYKNKQCTICHETTEWSHVEFDHNLTKWPLEGAHAERTCKDCHFEKPKKSNSFTLSFNTLDKKCDNCHNHTHNKNYVKNDISNCVDCHQFNDWFPSDFNHSKTTFPLTGQHAAVDCKACHTLTKVDGKSKIKFKLGKVACIDCH